MGPFMLFGDTQEMCCTKTLNSQSFTICDERFRLCLLVRFILFVAGVMIGSSDGLYAQSIYLETFDPAVGNPITNYGWLQDSMDPSSGTGRIGTFNATASGGDANVVYSFGNPGETNAFYTSSTISGGSFPVLDPTTYANGLMLSVDAEPSFNATPANPESFWAVQINGNDWYSSSSRLPLGTDGDGWDSYSFHFDSTASHWNSLTLTGGTGQPSIGAPATADLSGNITGLGVVTQYSSPSATHHFDNFEISPVPGPTPFYVGADISMVPFFESRGGVYRDNGVVKPAEQIFVDHGANMFRLRLFVDPDTNYDNPSNRGAIQDIEYVKSYARRVKATGAKYMLALHYSDTWTNPGLQDIPSGWPDTIAEMEQLKQQVYDYTTATLATLKNNGAMPDAVQIGNETTSGILWPVGEVDYSGSPTEYEQSWARYGELVNEAIRAVRDFQEPNEHIDIAITVAPADFPGQSGLPQWFVGEFTNLAGVTDFDVFGVDGYPEAQEHLDLLVSNLNSLANMPELAGKRIMVGETSYPWNSSLDGTSNQHYDHVYDPSTAPFGRSLQGQKEFFQAVVDAVKALPNDMGYGALWWYPEPILVPDTWLWQGGALAMFDGAGNALPVMDVFGESTPAALSGDFDLNGVVDGRDFLAWQRGESPVPYGAESLAVWESKYAESQQGLLSSSTTVPEPSTWTMVAGGLFVLLRQRRKLY